MGDDLQLRVLCDALAEALIALDAAGSAGQALDLADLAAFGQQGVGDVLAADAADVDVVGADELGVGVAVNLAVQQDDRDAGLVGALDDVGQRGGLVGGGDDQVDLHLDEVLDVSDLLGVVLGSVGVDNLEHRVLRRRGSDLVVHCNAPGLAQIALGHADGVGLFLCQRGAHRRRQNQHQKDGHKLLHRDIPPSIYKPAGL